MAATAAATAAAEDATRLGTNHTRVTHQSPVLGSSCDDTGRLRAAELLKAMDITACMSAERHCNRTSVTLSMDDVNFSDARAKVGDVIVIRSRVNRVWNTSMEVGLRVEIESPESGNTRHLCSSYFVFVALDEEGKKTKVPGIIPISDREKVRWALAEDRRRIRMDRAKLVGDVATVAGAIVKSPHGSHLRYSVGGASSNNNSNSSIGRGEAMKRMSTLMLNNKGGDADEERNEVTHMVLPQHCNHYGNTFGGVVLQWCHEAAEVAAARHARTSVVTVSVDDVFFLAPSKTGTRIVLKASVNRVFNRSMEVGVRVEGHFLNGDVTLINRAYFTLVAIPPPHPASSPLVPVVAADAAVQAAVPDKRRGMFGIRRPSEASRAAAAPALPPPPPAATATATAPTATAAEWYLRSVPLVTPEQIRRHQEALGRRRVRLERLQLRRSNHVAWPFTPDTDPRTFIIENLACLERVTMEAEASESQQGGGGGAWGLMSELDGVQCFHKVDMRAGVSLKTVCMFKKMRMDTMIAAVTSTEARRAWDKMVVGYEVRHTFPDMDADVVWLAVDMRPVNPSAHPTDFAMLRSWKGSAVDGTFVVASHSIVHHTVPGNKSFVRAEVGSSGFILTQHPDGVEITYVVQLNPQGTSMVASELDGSSRVAHARMTMLRGFVMQEQQRKGNNNEVVAHLDGFLGAAPASSSSKRGGEGGNECVVS